MYPQAVLDYRLRGIDDTKHFGEKPHRTDASRAIQVLDALAARVSTALQNSLKPEHSFPFKGEAGMGMGCRRKEDLHIQQKPIPILPTP